MRTIHPHGHPDVAARDDLLAEPLVHVQAADVVLAPRRFDHGALAEDQADSEDHLGDDAIVVVAFVLIGDGPGRAEADADERGALQGHIG